MNPDTLFTKYPWDYNPSLVGRRGAIIRELGIRSCHDYVYTMTSELTCGNSYEYQVENVIERIFTSFGLETHKPFVASWVKQESCLVIGIHCWLRDISQGFDNTGGFYDNWTPIVQFYVVCPLFLWYCNCREKRKENTEYWNTFGSNMSLV